MRKWIHGWMVSAAVVGLLAGVSALPAQTPGAASGQRNRPPEPDFDRPVDYLGWYTRAYSQPTWPKGSTIYAMIWSDAAAERITVPEGKLFGDLQIAARQPWQPTERAELATYLAGLNKDIEAFIKATETPDVRWRLANSACDWLLEETRRETVGSKPVWQALLPAVMADGWRVGADGKPDFDKLMTAWRAGLRYARHVQYSGGAVAYMTNGAIRSIVYLGIRNGLTLGLFDTDQIGRIQKMLQEEDGAANLSATYKFEWMALLDLMQQIYPSQQFSKTAALDLEQKEIAGLDQGSFPEAIPTALGIDTYFQQFVRAADQDWSLMTMQAADNAQRIKNAIADRNPVLMFYLPPMAMVYDFGIRLEAERRAVRLLLALAEKQKQSGNWPVSFDALSGDWVAAARIDPLTFPPREFGYRVVKGEPKLYTAGFDGDDDRGNHDRQWSRGKTGKDFVFFPSQQLADGSESAASESAAESSADPSSETSAQSSE